MGELEVSKSHFLELFTSRTISRENKVTLVDDSLSRKFRKTFLWLVKPPLNSRLGFHPFSLPHLSLWYSKETNSVELSLQQFEGTDSMKNRHSPTQGLWKEKAQNRNGSRSLVSRPGHTGPAAQVRAEAVSSYFSIVGQPLWAAVLALPQLAGQPASSALTSAASEHMPNPAHLSDGLVCVQKLFLSALLGYTSGG